MFSKKTTINSAGFALTEVFFNIGDTEQMPPCVFTDGPEAWFWFGFPSILDRSWTKFPGTEIELYFCIAL